MRTDTLEDLIKNQYNIIWNIINVATTLANYCYNEDPEITLGLTLNSWVEDYH